MLHRNKLVLIFVILINIVVFCCCKRNKVNETELVEYINNPKNGLVKEFQVDNICIKLKYKPNDFFIANELIAENNSNRNMDSLIDVLKSTYGKNIYFIVEISYEGKEYSGRFITDQNLYKNTIIEFQQFQNYIFYVGDDKDTIFPLATQYVPFYGHYNKNTFLIAFDREKLMINKKIIIVLNNPELNIPKTFFIFFIKDIQNCPTLNYSLYEQK